MNHFVQSRVLAGVLIFVLGCGISNGKEDSRPANQKPAQLPFAVSIVPSSSNVEPYGRGIAMAEKSPDAFYVILTNISKEPQLVFEPWNSWGYRSISFEIETADGHKFAISKKPQKFTVNFPSTFGIPPGEHMVYSISLNEKWKAVPPLPMPDETPIPITIIAIYEVSPSPEARKEKIWTGRLESSSYHFKFRHW